MSNSVLLTSFLLLSALIIYFDFRYSRVLRENLRQAERDAAERRQQSYATLLRGKGDPLQAAAAAMTEEVLLRVKAQSRNQNDNSTRKNHERNSPEK